MMQFLIAGCRRVAIYMLVFLLTFSPAGDDSARAQVASTVESSQRSLTDRSVDRPTWSQWRRVMLLQDYNTRVVLAGTTMLGAAAGAVGSFTLLRRRALMGDALSHATLPGIGAAFVIVTFAGGDGKSLIVLLAGATISGVLGLLAILFLRNATRLKEDTALGIVLSVFFGAGIAILGVAQQMKSGHAAGLEAFIYGKTASLGVGDATLIGISGILACLLCLLLFKEFQLLCFDEAFAASRGYPVILLDLLLMGLVVIVTIVGLQAVGLILVIALLIIPASAARFWTERMSSVALIAAVIGAVSSLIGSGLSAVLPRLPSGAMIVLVATVFFVLSLVFGRVRGVVHTWLRRRKLDALVHRQHVVRAAFEWLEAHGGAPDFDQTEPTTTIRFSDLVPFRSWSDVELRKYLRQAARERLLICDDGETFHLTPQGARIAAKQVHDHRLWELYLIEHADIAPAHVDRGADAIEHVLDAEMVAELEALLRAREGQTGVLPSPHPVMN